MFTYIPMNKVSESPQSLENSQASAKPVEVELKRSEISACGSGQPNDEENCDGEYLTAGDTASATGRFEDAPSASKEIGLNLSWNSDQVQQWMFVDAMKHARPWITKAASGWQEWNTEMQAEISWRPDGYPVEIPAHTSKGTQIVSTVMLSNHEMTHGNWPAGNYTVFFDGDGELSFTGDAVLVGQAPGQYIINIEPNCFVELQIRRSNRHDPVRNIRVIMPGFKKSYMENPFHPLLLERLGGVSALKFTALAATNFDGGGLWEQRVKADYFSQGTEKGVALEYMVQLANISHKDPWFNIPHNADDTYVEHYAEYLRDHLDPSLTVYLEYSNEVWNDAHVQSEWLRQRGCRDADTFTPLIGDADSSIIECDDFTAGMKATAKRMAQIFDIFDHVFADHSQRLVKVIGGNTHWYRYNDWLWHHFNDPSLNPNRVTADAFAIAPYFARSQNLDEIIQSEAGTTLTVNRILDLAAEDLKTDVNHWLLHFGSWTEKHNLHLLAYEGGNLLTYTEKGPELAEKIEKAWRHPRMGALYLDYFDRWRNAGGDLMVVSSYIGLPGVGATNGILKYQNQPLNDAYIYQAVMAATGHDQPLTKCGDGVTQRWETCDDGNTSNGDGCSEYCAIE